MRACTLAHSVQSWLRPVPAHTSPPHGAEACPPSGACSIAGSAGAPRPGAQRVLCDRCARASSAPPRLRHVCIVCASFASSAPRVRRLRDVCVVCATCALSARRVRDVCATCPLTGRRGRSAARRRRTCVPRSIRCAPPCRAGGPAPPTTEMARRGGGRVVSIASLDARPGYKGAQPRLDTDASGAINRRRINHGGGATLDVRRRRRRTARCSRRPTGPRGRRRAASPSRSPGSVPVRRIPYVLERVRRVPEGRSMQHQGTQESTRRERRNHRHCSAAARWVRACYQRDLEDSRRL
jgi:hypothetical protein